MERGRGYDGGMSDILREIVEHKRREVAEAMERVGLQEMRRRAQEAPPARNFFAAVTQPAGELRVIAEIKRASPSAGLIRKDADPAAIARAYYENGAAAISCLTDQRYFQGSLEDLKRVREAVPLPVLRKDFIVHPYQVYEARAAGADAILLIAECLEEGVLLDLLILATELRLTTLLEVHEVESLLRVRPHIGFPHPSYVLLGINNRNLKTMKVDLTHTLRMLEMVEDPSVVVAESGIRTAEDVVRLRAAGVHRILVGEHLMRQRDPGQALRTLIEGSRKF